MNFVAGNTIVPVAGATLMSRQGMRPGRTTWHNGIDLSVPVGTPVYPAAAGTIYRTSTACLSHVATAALSRREIQRRGGPCACPNCTTDSSGKKNCGATYGNTVVVKHGEDFYTVYAHLDTILVIQDQVVTTATQLGTVGTTTALLVGTGADAEPVRCTTMVPHLHFEVTKEWPLAPDNTTARYDALHELAAGGVAISGEGLAITGIVSSYAEPALAVSKGVAKTSLSYDPVPPETPDQVEVSKWPLYVGLTGLALAAILILWKLRGRLPGRGPGRE